MQSPRSVTRAATKLYRPECPLRHYDCPEPPVQIRPTSPVLLRAHPGHQAAHGRDLKADAADHRLRGTVVPSRSALEGVLHECRYKIAGRIDEDDRFVPPKCNQQSQWDCHDNPGEGAQVGTADMRQELGECRTRALITIGLRCMRRGPGYQDRAVRRQPIAGSCRSANSSCPLVSGPRNSATMKVAAKATWATIMGMTKPDAWLAAK
jgi:hypothetical protein